VEAATMARALGDDRLLAVAQGRGGSALLALGQLEEARRVLSEEVIPRAETAGDALTWRHALINLGAIATYRGDFDQARDYAERALSHAEQLDDRAGLVSLIFQRGLLTFYLGEWGQAHAEYHRAAGLAPTGALTTYPLGGLGQLSLAAGDEEAASRYFTEAL